MFTSRSVALVLALALLAAACTAGADPTTTAPVTTVPTTVAPATTLPATTTTSETPPPSTTTTTAGHQELTIEEAEAFVAELEAGRLHAIWAKDADALWEYVATQAYFDGAVSVFETLEILEEPRAEAIQVDIIEIFLDRADCRVIGYHSAAPALFGEGDSDDLIAVYWPTEDGVWRSATSWGAGTPQEFWQADCDILEREDTP